MCIIVLFIDSPFIWLESPPLVGLPEGDFLFFQIFSRLRVLGADGLIEYYLHVRLDEV